MHILPLAGAGALVAGILCLPAPPVAAQPSAPVPPQSLAATGAARLVAARPAQLHASARDAFTAQPVITTNAGLEYVPYTRTHAGLPVIGGDFVIATDATGAVVATSVAQTRTIDLASTTAAVSAESAQAVARTKLSTVDTVTGARQVVYALGAPRLAWETTVSGREATRPTRLTVVVDATTGAVLDTQEQVLHGLGTSAYNGPNPLNLDTTSSGGTFALTDPSHADVTCQNSLTNQTFTGPDDLWGNGDPGSLETGCVDALFAVQTEQRMLASWLGRAGIKADGGGYPIRVGLNDVDAFYDHTQVQIGHNLDNRWLSSIDVVAHENGHAIDDNTPGGTSHGGTQEFVADVFGAATEWFAGEPAGYDSPDFLVGETVNMNGTGPVRSMYDPSMYGDPNCYSSAIPTAEVHDAAGPGNHWFYLLAQGSGAVPFSPTCNGGSVTGIGVMNAAKIFYNAMLLKTTASSYLNYRVWTLTAAKNLFPGDCAKFYAVRAAWDAVSVPAQAGEPACDGSATKIFDDYDRAGGSTSRCSSGTRTWHCRTTPISPSPCPPTTW